MMLYELYYYVHKEEEAVLCFCGKKKNLYYGFVDLEKAFESQERW